MMDSLASLNIIPFLGLMNILEVKYLHMPEVYRTMLAILCDYNPLLQNNIIRTRRYIKVLLAREPDLAQCLLNFMDEPQENTDNCSYTDGSFDSDKSQHSHHSCSFSLYPQSSEVSQVEHKHHNAAVSSNASGLPQQGSPSYTIDNNFKTGLISIPPLATVDKSDFPAMNTFQTNISRDMSTSAAASGHQYLFGMSKSQSCGDRVPHFVPVINIQQKGVFPSEFSAASTSAGHHVQDVPLFLSHLLSSSSLSPSAAHGSLDQSGIPLSSEPIPSAVTTCEQKYTPSAGHLLVKTETIGTITSSDYLEHSNVKSSRKYRVAQTQTSTADPMATSKLHKATATEEALPLLKKRSEAGPTSRSQAPPPVSAASQASSLPSPSSGGGCLSKLLGQPSVAYLPAGHFIDNRNCIVGEPKSTLATVEKPPFYAASLSGKVSSAAAKLRLLSTQAGEDRGATGPVHAGFRQAGTTVTAKLGSLSVKTSLEHTEEVKKTTAFRFSSRSGESKKTLALSKILPVPKPDNAAATADASSVQQKNQAQEQITSSDKQIQVGQKQVAKKAMMSVEEREETSQFFSLSHVAQEFPMNQKVGPPLSVSHQQAMEKKTSSMTEGNSGLDAIEEAKKTLSASRKLGSKWLPGQQEKKKLGTSHMKPTEKGLPQSSKLVISKSGTSKQKVQVVEVSLGGTHSLSSFPYIQQMVLPDGQVSTIAHNSSQGHKAADHDTQPPSPVTESKPAKTFTQSKSQNHLGTHHGKIPFEKPKTQTILSRNQVKLSISIQTSSPKPCTSSSRKQSLTAGQQNSPDHVETLKSPPEKKHMPTHSESKEKELEDAGISVYEDESYSAAAGSLIHTSMPSSVVNRGKGKRKRPCSCPQNASSRTSKKSNNTCDGKNMPAMN